MFIVFLIKADLLYIILARVSLCITSLKSSINIKKCHIKFITINTYFFGGNNLCCFLKNWPLYVTSNPGIPSANLHYNQFLWHILGPRKNKHLWSLDLSFGLQCDVQFKGFSGFSICKESLVIFVWFFYFLEYSNRFHWNHLCPLPCLHPDTVIKTKLTFV